MFRLEIGFEKSLEEIGFEKSPEEIGFEKSLEVHLIQSLKHSTKLAS